MIGGCYGYCDLVDTRSVYIRYFEAETIPGYSVAFFGHFPHGIDD